MSSLPSENLVDVLRPLDRWTLDTVQITSQRFRQLTVERMSSECLRAIKAAHFCSYTGRSWVKAVGRADRLEQLLEAHADFAGFFSAFLDAVRSSWIADLLLEGRLIVARLRFEVCANEGRKLGAGSWRQITGTMGPRPAQHCFLNRSCHRIFHDWMALRFRRIGSCTD
jgi:hypothetical protein